MKPRTELAFLAGLCLACGAARAQSAAAPAQEANPAPSSAAPAPAPAPGTPNPNAENPAPQNAPPDRQNLEATKAQLTELPPAEKLRPSGPVTITANRAEVTQGNAAVYVGNVQLSSDTLKLDGDRLELKRFADGQYQAKVTGAPAHLAHPGGGADDPPMSAQAKTLDYDSRSGIVDLVGEAVVTKGGQRIAADTIHYNLIERRIEASGGDGGQVKIVIPPAPAGPSDGGSHPSATPAWPPAPAGGQGSSPATPAHAPADTAPAQPPQAPASSASRAP
jgi:lipopolysaccharide export system protein LptA